MKTKMMSMFLAFCMLASLVIPASAAEPTVASEQGIHEDQFIDNSTYLVDPDELPHTPYNPLPVKEENLSVTNSTAVVIHDDPEDSLYNGCPQSCIWTLYKAGNHGR